MTNALRQTATDIDAIYQQAAVAMVELAAVIKVVAQETAATLILPPLKGQARAVEKAQLDYAGDVSRLIDICRASVVVRTKGQVAAVLMALRSRFDVVRIKDRFAAPVLGYRDACLTIRVAGHLCEVQVHVESIATVKESVHGIYEQYRVMDSTAAESQRLAAEMEAQYEAAWA